VKSGGVAALSSCPMRTSLIAQPPGRELRSSKVVQTGEAVEVVFVEHTRAGPDAIETPFGGVSHETGETACTSVMLRKLSDAQYTK
jgi:hypothetical protein